MIEMPSSVAELSLAEKRALLARLLQQQLAQPKAFPLSFAQERLWFLDQLLPGNPAYNIPLALQLSGRLDRAALERALNEIVRRHEILRTTFALHDGQPMQIVAPALHVPLPLEDLRGLPERERASAVQRFLVTDGQQPLDLERGPLLRATLLRVADEEHVLALVTHHIIFDGSMDMLFRELTTLYSAFVQGQPSPLPELKIQYADFAAWQRQWLQSEVRDQQLDYWKQQLGGELPVLQLPTDRPRPPIQSFNGRTHTFRLPRALSEAVVALSRQEEVTAFMTALAAFQVLLARYTGQDDILVGAPVADRPRSETADLIGCFVNTFVLRGRLDGDPSFRTLLRRVRETALGAFANQDLPFELIVEELQPERDLSRMPLFQVMFVLQHNPPQRLDVPGLNVRLLPIDIGAAKFDLLMSVWEEADGLVGLIEYNTDLFDEATIARLAAHYETLLAGIIADPDQRLSRLPLLPAAEARRIIHEWNATEAAYERDVCMHQLFERQVERAPDAVALVSDRERLSYRELNERANQIAHHLQSLGVGPDALVVVYMQRTPDTIAALLGILKAGAAYVPLEPSFPQARSQGIIASLGIRWIITQQPQLPALAEMSPALPALEHVLTLDPAPIASPPQLSAARLWQRADLASRPVTNPNGPVNPASLAYIIFTSGSTGTPKGVMVRHQPVINLIEWINRRFEIGPRDQVLFVTSLCFDLSVYDIFGLLAAGGSLRIVAEQDIRDPERLITMLCDEPITFWDSAPAALKQLAPFFPLSQGRPGTDSLRLVFLSGDWIPVSLPDQVRETFPNAEVISLGGATEATVWSNFHPIAAVDPGWISIPYGKPIQNARYYILDATLQPAPIGVPGDLFIGGECLAEGYVNDPVLTSQKFIADPFDPRPGARMYRTGDRARFWADGTMEFLGRLDHQVKIRGFRIELGEIETVLGQHPAIRATTVLAREDQPGDKRLVGYLVARPEHTLDIEDVRAYLKSRLPEYMVPSAFVAIDAIPVTSNGKVDRKALPAPEIDGEQQEFTAPRSTVEELLADLWAAVLGRERVGIHDNFFALGGDSILSIQMIARARQAGLQITPRQVYQHQTIAELVAVVDTGPLVEAEQAPVTGEAPLTPIQRWFFEQELAEPQHWNQSVLLSVPPALETGVLEQIVRALLVQHDALRVRFEQTSTGWLQRITEPDDSAPVTHLDLSSAPIAQRAAAIERVAAEVQASLDLSDGPLLSFAHIDLGPETAGRLLIVVHHLAVDGISWRILLDDLQTAFDQLARGEPLTLPAKTSSIKAWSERLTQHAQQPAVQQELAFWQAAPRDEIRRLPVDHPGGANSEASLRWVSLALTAAETDALLHDVPAAYQSQINDVLLTALAQAATGWTGSPLLLTALEGHGREDLFDDLDLSRTVGWFTTIYPALLDLRGVTEPGAALKAIKEQLRAIPNNGFGYGLLRYLSQNDETVAALEALPQPEISFNYLGQLDRILAESGPVQAAPEATGPERSLSGGRRYLLDISARVAGGQLSIDWGYSAQLHERATIERLAERFVTALRALIAHCSSADAGGFTPSDFPEAALDQQELDALLDDIDAWNEDE
jgi:amino acid adenylation domain-containing protein/non-ribosomal peptide synthase protein (TIGR01720 family)